MNIIVRDKTAPSMRLKIVWVGKQIDHIEGINRHDYSTWTDVFEVNMSGMYKMFVELEQKVVIRYDAETMTIIEIVSESPLEIEQVFLEDTSVPYDDDQAAAFLKNAESHISWVEKIGESMEKPSK